jgi:hypothetical protein
LPTRYALALIPLIAVVLVDALDRAAQGGLPSILVPTATLVALLPLLPVPLPTTARAPVPEFISSGAWRECVPEGGVLVPVPLPTAFKPDAMRWAAAAKDAFAIPEGFFFGPYGDGGRRTTVGTYPRPTSQLLTQVATGVPQPVSEATRAQARLDLAFWKADCVALAHGPHEAELRSTLEQLLGPGTQLAGTWTWRVSR